MLEEDKMNLRNLLLFCRVFEWGVHLLVFILIALCCYFTIVITLTKYLYYVLGVSAYFIFVASFGYICNDFSDRDIDMKQGKTKYLTSLPSVYVRLILSLLIVLAIGVLSILNSSFEIIALGIFQIIFAYLYSMKPIRLKERGILGIFSAAIIQRIPPLIILSILTSLNIFVVVYVSAWLSILGGLFIIEHQIEDHKVDYLSGVKTFVVSIGIKKALRYRSYSYYTFYLFVSLLIMFDFLRVTKEYFNPVFISTVIGLSLITTILLKRRYKISSRLQLTI